MPMIQTLVISNLYTVCLINPLQKRNRQPGERIERIVETDNISKPRSVDAAVSDEQQNFPYSYTNNVMFMSISNILNNIKKNLLVV